MIDRVKWCKIDHQTTQLQTRGARVSPIYLLNITGQDRVGLTRDIFAVIGDLDVRILDIGQSVIHNQVSQGMMLQLPDGPEHQQILEQLQAQASALHLKVNISPVDIQDYQHWVGQQGADRYTLTLLTREVSAEEIARVTQAMVEHDLNIHDIARLSGRLPVDQPISNEVKSCVEFSLQGRPKDIAAMRASFLKIASELDVDIAIQEDNAFRRSRRLVCFDMDSTLIDAEVIDELARHAGVGAEVAAITDQAMRGELDFRQSFIRRMSLLKGLSETVLEQVAAELPIMEGAECLIKNLKAYGFKTAILSGGFTYFGKHLQQRFGIDHVYANQLEIVDGQLTGRVIEPVVDGARKAELLYELARLEGVDAQQTIAVGDGANDLPMLSAAGLGIAFRAKPLVREAAKQSMSTHGLDSILYLLGYKDKDILR
ncbi:MAG: phosphoserine phosphatase SerB [Gammaproteobacteria bacterium]|nr:phosphoserine phosphatase SerB [Gammaproteobacteria bacterium]